jgi:hypothetical protein
MSSSYPASMMQHSFELLQQLYLHERAAVRQTPCQCLEKLLRSAMSSVFCHLCPPLSSIPDVYCTKRIPELMDRHVVEGAVREIHRLSGTSRYPWSADLRLSFEIHIPSATKPGSIVAATSARLIEVHAETKHSRHIRPKSKYRKYGEC